MVKKTFYTSFNLYTIKGFLLSHKMSCRICFEEESDDNIFVSPCACKVLRQPLHGLAYASWSGRERQVRRMLAPWQPTAPRASGSLPSAQAWQHQYWDPGLASVPT